MPQSAGPFVPVERPSMVLFLRTRAAVVRVGQQKCGLGQDSLPISCSLQPFHGFIVLFPSHCKTFASLGQEQLSVRVPSLGSSLERFFSLLLIQSRLQCRQPSPATNCS